MKQVLNDSEPTLFQFTKRKRVQNKGRPIIQRAMKGRPNDNDQIKCQFFQQVTVKSPVNKNVLSILVQLKRLITFEEVLEYKLKKRVITVITINHLQFTHFQRIIFVSPKIPQNKIRIANGMKLLIKVLNRNKLFLNACILSLIKQSYEMLIAQF